MQRVSLRKAERRQSKIFVKGWRQVVPVYFIAVHTSIVVFAVWRYRVDFLLVKSFN